MIFKKNSARRSITAIILAVIWLQPVSATTLLPITLPKLSEQAALIFYGSVTDSRSIEDESGRIVTLTEFNVHELIKGEAATTHTIKQLGGTLADGRSLNIHGVPAYRPGERYVIFLPQASALGFSSPLGLQQGNFSVIEVDGKTVVSNGRNLQEQNDERMARAPLATMADDPTRASLADFINTVRALNQE